MAFKIEEAFDVQAPVQRVWEYLIDPASVAVCLPGAELLESRADGSYLGAVKVKVGPVAMSYKGVVKFTELDKQARLVRLVGEGREAGGGGSAKLTMLSKITDLPTGGSHVIVEAEVDLVGKIVQFGRGMIEEVSRQLFRQFAACAKQHLEIADKPETVEGVQASEEPPVEVKAVSAIPLALRALWAMVVRLFKRLFGKQAG
ncbi:MAG TPA: SRPBCC family protein [Blastocatellia bacterium]|nr:SRPBCC family protein [Blastocatellia bacterium]